MSDFLDQFDKIPLSQKIVLLVVLMAALFVGYFFLFDQKIEEQAKAEAQRVVELSDKKQDLQASSDDFEALKKEIDQLCVRQESFMEKLPAQEEIESLLQTINQQGQLTGLSIKAFARKENEPGANYTTIPVEMELEGTYDEIADFFYFIGRQQRIVNASNISLGVLTVANPWVVREGSARIQDFAKARDEIGPPELTVRCDLATYFTDAAKSGQDEICKKEDGK